MVNLHQFKANEKLPLGSFFYVKVGDLFYAGDKPAFRDYKVANYRTGFDDSSVIDYWFFGKRNARDKRDLRKKNVAKYRVRPKSKSDSKKEFTETFNPILVDTLNEVKKYRTKSQAEKACERLKSVYRDLELKITIEFEGEIK